MLDKKIQYFIAVAECGSFSAAARKLLLSQSALSQQIALLEAELGIRLLDRSGYRPALTEAGKKYYRFCSDAEQQYQEMLKDLRPSDKKSITIAFSGIYENKDLIRFTSLYRKQHPSVSFTYLEGTFDEIRDNLISGSADIAFSLQTSFVGQKDLTIRTLFSYEMCVITSFDHPLTNHSEVSPDDLRNQPFIVLSRRFGKNFKRQFMQSFLRDGLSKDQIVKETDTFDELMAAVSIGEGISIVSTEVIDEHAVKKIPLINSNHHETYVLAYPKEARDPELLQFISSASDYFDTIR